MQIISFDVSGKMAHFRKYYANNTAFSFSLPPRTTIMGMLANMMGYPRDSYYAAFASKYLRIGIRVMTPIKKTFHRMNMLSIKSTGDAMKGTGDFTGVGGRTQIPFEIVTGQDLRFDFVVYRIFLGVGEEDNGEFAKLKELILQKKQHFNLTLGTANFSSSIRNQRLYEKCKPTFSNEAIKIHSAIPSHFLKKMDANNIDDNFIEEELLPADFIKDFDRELSKMNRLIYSTKGLPISVNTEKPFFNILDENGNNQNIMFME